jgi:hypothetical protein
LPGKKNKTGSPRLGLQYLERPVSKKQQEIQPRKLFKPANKRKINMQGKVEIVQFVNQTGD